MARDRKKARQLRGAVAFHDILDFGRDNCNCALQRPGGPTRSGLRWKSPRGAGFSFSAHAAFRSLRLDGREIHLINALPPRPHSLSDSPARHRQVPGGSPDRQGHRDRGERVRKGDPSRTEIARDVEIGPATHPSTMKVSSSPTKIEAAMIAPTRFVNFPLRSRVSRPAAAIAPKLTKTAPCISE